VRENWARSWVACAIDSEGSLTLARTNFYDAAKGRKKKWGTPEGTYVPYTNIYNTDMRYINHCFEIIKSWGVDCCVRQLSKQPKKKASYKTGYGVIVCGLEPVSTLLSIVLPYMVIKGDFASSLISLCAYRMSEVRREGNNSKTPWSAEAVCMAKEIRERFMPRRNRANGETLLSVGAERAIPCQAE
jgi:hypothetical protein